MSYLAYFLNVLLMIAMPLGLGVWISARRQPGWSLFGMGAIAFVVSQIAHIPFNWLVLQRLNLLPNDIYQPAHLIILALFLGLSAGVFEESARYFTYRYWAVEARSWGRGLMLGAGHGGSEAILLGLIVGGNYLILARMRQGALLSLVPEGQLPMVQKQIAALFSAPWYLILLGAVERLFALCFHLSASLLVMQVFIRQQYRWLVMAVIWHTLLNAVSVFSVATWNAYVTEAMIGVMAVASLGIVFWLRQPEPVEPDLIPLPPAGPVQSLDLELTERALEESRYS
jgi:uncharacterized membrane protein YhfC